MFSNARVLAVLLLLSVLGLPVVGNAAVSTNCLPTVLPTSPGSPVYSQDVSWGYSSNPDRMRLDIWRQPCLDGTGSAILMRVTPITPAPYFCYLDLKIVQGTTQFNSVVAKLKLSDFGGFCDDTLIAQTFVLAVGSSAGVQFNEAQAFTLFYDGSAQLYQLQVPDATGTALPVSLAGAAILPSSRSVQVGTTATAFATVIAAGAGTASGCVIAPQTSVPAAFSFQTTDPATNAITGTPNAPVDIVGGALQTFMIAFTPSAPFVPTDVRLTFDCTNTNPVASIAGVNTLLLSGSSSAVPDIIALAATFGNDGIVNIPGASGTGAFAIASVNVGAAGSMTVAPDTGGRSLAVQLTLCQTNPATGACLAPPTGSVTTQINGMETPTFAIFVKGTGTVAFNPGTNRIFLRFKDAGAVTRGATSVAVRTQ